MDLTPTILISAFSAGVTLALRATLPLLLKKRNGNGNGHGPSAADDKTKLDLVYSAVFGAEGTGGLVREIYELRRWRHDWANAEQERMNDSHRRKSSF